MVSIVLLTRYSSPPRAVQSKAVKWQPQYCSTEQWYTRAYTCEMVIIPWNHTQLHYSALHCTDLFCTELFCTELFSLSCFSRSCSALRCSARSCSHQLVSVTSAVIILFYISHILCFLQVTLMSESNRLKVGQHEKAVSAKCYISIHHQTLNGFTQLIYPL